MKQPPLPLRSLFLAAAIASALPAMAFSQTREVAPEDVPPFTAEERQQMDAAARSAAARAQREAADAAARWERVECLNGMFVTVLQASAADRFHFSVGIAAGTRAPFPLPDVGLAAEATWVLGALNWSCHLPTMKQLEEAGIHGPLELILPLPRHQLAAAVTADLVAGTKGPLARAGVTLLGGTGLQGPAHPRLSLSVSAGPSIDHSGPGLGVSTALGLWAVQLGARMELREQERYWLLSLSLRDFGRYLP